jgi:hypothetical protein
LPYAPPPRPAPGKGWLVAAVAAGVTLALLGAIVVARGRHAQQTAASDAAAAAVAQPFDLDAAGYKTFTGPKGLTMLPGAPWGTPCAPIVLTLDANAPEEMIAAASQVASEANGDGLNVVYGDTTGTYDVSRLRNVAADGTGVHAINVNIKKGIAPKLASGKPGLVSIGWNASLASDGRHEQLTKVVADVYAGSVAHHDAVARDAMRTAVAWGLGLSQSSQDGSALNKDLKRRSDAFIDIDVAALRAMSGCG